MKNLIPLIFVFVFFSCTKEEIIQPQQTTSELVIDSVLTQDGSHSLMKDQNGIYHLRLVVNGTQQFHRITGRFLINGKEPLPNAKVEWENNMYWNLKKGDTVATIIQTYINYFTGQFTVVQLPPLISSKDELVPTINKSSYTGRGGEINTIIAPIREMKGDTMIVKTYNTEFNKKVYTKIVLE